MAKKNPPLTRKPGKKGAKKRGSNVLVADLSTISKSRKKASKKKPAKKLSAAQILAKKRSAASKRGWDTRRANEQAAAKKRKLKSRNIPANKRPAARPIIHANISSRLERKQHLLRSEAAKKGWETRKRNERRIKRELLNKERYLSKQEIATRELAAQKREEKARKRKQGTLSKEEYIFGKVFFPALAGNLTKAQIRAEHEKRQRAVKTGRAKLSREGFDYLTLVKNAPESIQAIIRNHAPTEKRTKRQKDLFLRTLYAMAEQGGKTDTQIQNILQHYISAGIFDWKDCLDYPWIYDTLGNGVEKKKFDKAIGKVMTKTGLSRSEIYTLWLYR
jgi:hypothetical protein